MTEKSLEYPFRRELQRLLPDAVVLKHSDSGMIGLPDCSVTYGGRVWWLEFKLLRPPKHDALPRLWAESEMAARLMKDDPQTRLMRRLAAAGRACYVAWLSTGEALVYQVDGTTVWTDRRQAPTVVRNLIFGNQG